MSSTLFFTLPILHDLSWTTLVFFPYYFFSIP
ncbi:hypothetical protein Zm00014a_005306 [Zea mays]|uniref:Uncharacterized protein n=1 Tax=Zea mays TaxID=4577 RepID=A0A3L6F3Z2_MAIZE|nr:hypothetical protein Zm00014a_005306 [Zea mays]